MATLANNFANNPGIEVHLILYMKNEVFYNIDPKISIHYPGFNYKNYPFFIYIFLLFGFIRKTLKKIRPASFLSFGGKYNSFVLLASEGLEMKRFISDRSRPSISYGKLTDLLNRFMYRRATGIIAQTDMAKKVLKERTGHSNIKVIPNPVREIPKGIQETENIILNVGRFIKSKNQELLLEYFAEIDPENWRLVFIGDGPLLEKTQEKARTLGINVKTEFLGVVDNVDTYYQKSKIFAFTSISEGFPNALAEAMCAGCACISFDCEAGPGDLITNNKSGFLVPINDNRSFVNLVKELIDSPTQIDKFSKEAVKLNSLLNSHKISKKYLSFISDEKSSV